MLVLTLLLLCVHTPSLHRHVQQALRLLPLAALPRQQVHALQAALAAAAAAANCKLRSCIAHILLLLMLLAQPC
jgi:hypothetical protein